MENKYNDSELKHMSDLISDYVSEEEFWEQLFD